VMTDPWTSGAPEPVLVTIGDITVTPSWVVTPAGSAPVSSVQWHVTDMSVTTREIPTWAIVCAVIFFLFCFLGLLFLLAKEERTVGSVQVVAQAPGLLYSTQIPVWSLHQVHDVNGRVNYARSIAMTGR